MRERRLGSFLILLGTLAFACVSGGGDDPAKSGPECYSNSDCQNGHECSGGICVGYYSCATDEACRNNEDCLDGACRIPCKVDEDCEDQGLICGNGQGESQHCKPAPNPARGQTKTMNGTGSTGSTSSAGAPTSSAGAPTSSAGASAGGTPGAGGMSNAAGMTAAQTTAGRPGG